MRLQRNLHNNTSSAPSSIWMLCHTLTNVLSSNTKPAGTGDSGMMVPSSIEPKWAGDCQKNQEERGTQKEKNTKKKQKETGGHISTELVARWVFCSLIHYTAIGYKEHIQLVSDHAFGAHIPLFSVSLTFAISPKDNPVQWVPNND